ncbi:MAG: histidinol-phosphatase HisJ family protein [Roseburia sp.]
MTLLSPLWDTHMHSQYSGDSNVPQESMIHASMERGLAGICFTDHLHINYPGEPELFLLDLPNYHASVTALKEQYQSRFPIHFGVELGLQPQLAGLHADILAQYPFDFVIGSSHVVHGQDPYYPPYWENRTEEEGIQEYLLSILENIRAFDGFDVYGHLDYVVRYLPSRRMSAREASGTATALNTPASASVIPVRDLMSDPDCSDLIDTILRLLIEKGKGIEVNTGGFKYKLGHPNPTESVLARYHELGGEIITLGADAHAPEHVGYDFEKLPQLLKAAGFSYYTVFQERKPKFLPL